MWLNLNRYLYHRYISRAFRNKAAEKLFADLLPRFAKPGVSPEELATYRVAFRFGRRDSWDSDGWPYWDDKFGISLKKAGCKKNVACLAFDSFGRSVVVRQIQGHGGYEKELAQIRWEKLLVTFLRELLRSFAWCNRICIIQAKQCYYYRQGEQRRHGLSRRYDGTARALKFRVCPQTKLWAQPLRT